MGKKKNKQPKAGKAVKAFAQHPKIKFLHPKKASSAFGNKMNKPAGTVFSFENYISKKKKNKTKTGDGITGASQNGMDAKGAKVLSIGRKEVIENTRKNSKMDFERIFEKNHVSHAEKSASIGSLKKKRVDAFADMNGHPSPSISGLKEKAVPYSVEEAVADRMGCRPRSNSTDGELNLPRKGLCDEGLILRSYRWASETGATMPMPGLRNLGNTCFMNATLQCLAYLPTFSQCAAEFQSRSKKGKNTIGQKMFLMLRSLIRKLHGIDGNSQQFVSPKAIAQSLSSLSSGKSSRFRLGRQEDAHEFLVHMLDAMKEGELCAAGIDSRKSGWRDRLPIPRLDETTMVHRIFGGYLRSQVQCTNCGYRSNTYDPFFDLDLEVSKKSANSVSSAFEEFTRKETLDKQNRWRCSGCKKYVCATKQLTVFRPPLTLCIQLKRFTFTSFGGGKGRNKHMFGRGGGGKISKSIHFPAQLSLPLSDKRTCEYSLTGVTSHIGGSSSSGHYTAYVKKPSDGSDGRWFHMDDDHVTKVSEKIVLKDKNAYILFYCRKEVKLEFPPPPSGGLSSKEAVKLVTARARARADSLADSVSSREGLSKSSVNKHFPKSPQLSTPMITKEISDINPSSPSSEDESLSDVKKTLNSALKKTVVPRGPDAENVVTKKDTVQSESESDSVSEKKDDDLSAISESLALVKQKGPLTESWIDSGDDPSIESDDFSSSDESSVEMTELMKLAVIEKDKLDDDDRWMDVHTGVEERVGNSVESPEKADSCGREEIHRVTTSTAQEKEAENKVN
eukprot:CAMPEP_0116038990 /NCGR_PEP_ID=MMETSP0321-20121206/23221_1 /TAXON_ID=163516 /ORGANISM="Leptocylindrus danicus var. danicus, Strain B650" /LENGTH=789 /DNA_ID=CAMNT_0003517977 /DNA_START=182 /DNA_END=2548 /DNA_ORIENTATION=-